MKKSNRYPGKMTKALYTATAEYIEEVNFLPVKRQVSVSGILKKLGISRSGYHAWKKRVPSNTELRRAVLKEKYLSPNQYEEQFLENLAENVSKMAS